MIAMLLGLVFRGVAFEFRWRETRHRRVWDIAFAVGSIVAAASQGVIVGAITQGIRVSNGAYIGGWLDWLSPFSLLTGCALVVGYALLGSTWLIWKTDGEVQERARRLALPLGAATCLALVAISIATPLLAYDYWKRWFSLPAVFWTSQVPLSVLVVAIVFVLESARRRTNSLFQRPRCFLSDVRGFGHQPLSGRCPALPYDLGRGLTARKPEIHALWCA